MPLPQAPERQTKNIPITPIVGDILVSITKEYLRKDLPAYGTTMAEMYQGAVGSTKFANHVFTLAVPLDNVREEIYTCYFAAPREDQDLYNWEVTQADIGGTKFDAVSRTYVIPRDDYDMADPAMGSAMPDLPAGKFDTPSGYVLAIKSQRRTEKEFDSYFIVETRVYVRKTTITQIGVDSLNGETLSSTSTLYHKDEVVTGILTAAQLFALPGNSYWGLQATGYQVSGRQLSSEWYEIVSDKVIGGTFSGGSVSVDSAPWETTENYYWPPVLNQLSFLNWERNDNGVDIYPAIRFEPEGYNGPCRAVVTRTWKSTPFTNIDIPEQFLPTRVYYASPYFTLNIPECLHVKFFAQCDILATDDPIYTQNTGSKRYFSATNYTSWPETMLASDGQTPFRGGFLRTRVVVDRPVFPDSTGWTDGVDP